MKTIRLLILCFVFLQLISCTKSPGPQKDALVEVPIEEKEELDPVLTEEWPDQVGDITLTDGERKILEFKLGGLDYELTPHAAERIQSQFIFLARKNPKTVRRWALRSELYLPYIKKVFAEEGLPEELAYLPFVESGFNPKAYSRAGAAGLWQFMPATGRKFGLRVDRWIDERRDPFLATHAAVGYFKALYSMFGDWTLALASYNAGEAKIDKALKATNTKTFFELSQKNHTIKVHKIRLRKETMDFVPRLIAVAKIVNNLEVLNIPPIKDDLAGTLVHLKAKPGTDLGGLARSCGMTWKDFRAYNLAFRRKFVPPGKTSTVHVPATQVAAAETYIAKPASRVFKDHTTYVVRKGDTWSRISKRNGVPIAVLKRANNTSSNLLKLGQRVIVPIDPDGGRYLAKKKRKNTYLPDEGDSYVVKRGDTPSQIAQRNGVSTKALLRANGLKSAKSLRAGQTILIPKKRVASSSKKKTKKQTSSKSNYVVRKGETLSHIADRTGVPVKHILKANNLRSAKSLRAGQKIYIPEKPRAKAPKTTPEIAQKRGNYVIKKGDTLYGIAKKTGVSVQTLLEANGLKSAKSLRAGHKLYIPKQSSPPKKISSTDSNNTLVYHVKSGDTLGHVANKFKVSTSDICKWNKITQKSTLRPGDALTIHQN